MDVSSRQDGKLQVSRHVDQRPTYRQVPPHAVSLNFHEESIGPKHRLAPFCDSARSVQSFAFKRSRQQSITTRARENDEPLVPRFELCERQSRVETLGAEVGLREQ